MTLGGKGRHADHEREAVLIFFYPGQSVTFGQGPGNLEVSAFGLSICCLLLMLIMHLLFSGLRLMSLRRSALSLVSEDRKKTYVEVLSKVSYAQV